MSGEPEPEPEPAAPGAVPTSRLTKIAVLGGVGALGLVAVLCVLAVTVGPSLLVPDDGDLDAPALALARADARSALVLAALVLAVSVGAAAGLWRLDLAQRRNAAERDQRERHLQAIDRRLDEQARHDARAELTRRFETAVRLLGDDTDLGARLGGVFTLERLAVEARARREPWTGEGTEPRDLRHTVEQVLAAFARHRSTSAAAADGDAVADTGHTAPDVQAALTVLGRLGHPPPYDLRGLRAPRADLRWAVLRWAELGGAVLPHADLEGAVLAHAHLQGTDLTHADLEGADLREADLRGAVLREGYLKHAYLQYADLRGADLRDADLGGADLSGADLEGADLEGAYLREVTADETTRWPDGVEPVG